MSDPDAAASHVALGPAPDPAHPAPVPAAVVGAGVSADPAALAALHDAVSAWQKVDARGGPISATCCVRLLEYRVRFTHTLPFLTIVRRLAPSAPQLFLCHLAVVPTPTPRFLFHNANSKTNEDQESFVHWILGIVPCHATCMHLSPQPTLLSTQTWLFCLNRLASRYGVNLSSSSSKFDSHIYLARHGPWCSA